MAAPPSHTQIVITSEKIPTGFLLRVTCGATPCYAPLNPCQIPCSETPLAQKFDANEIHSIPIEDLHPTLQCNLELLIINQIWTHILFNRVVSATAAMFSTNQRCRLYLLLHRWVVHAGGGGRHALSSVPSTLTLQTERIHLKILPRLNIFAPHVLD